ncbi:MAG: polysaccharide biosynthesis tyrosine autokinase [Pseudomonadota bacterium]
MNENFSRLPTDPRGRTNGVVPIQDRDRSNVLMASELGYYEETDETRFDFRQALGIILSRKWLILAITILGIAIAFVLTLRVTPLYSAYTTIEIQQQEVQIIEGSNVGPDLVADSAYMETQIRLIRSRSIGERVAEDLDLVSDPRYVNLDAPRDIRLMQAASRVSNGTRVSPVGRSRLVGISYVSPDRLESARIANGVAEAYIQTNLERKFNTNAFARNFLDERLETTKQLLEDSERNFTRYAEEQGLLDLGGSTTGAGSLEENAIISLNSELSIAESERIKAEQEYLVAMDTLPPAELLQSTTLTSLRENRSELLADYQEMLSRFKPDYPDMVRLQDRIDGIEREIEREANTIVRADRNELRLVYEAAVAREQSLRDRVDELRLVLQDERNRRIQYRILQREVETIRAQYEALLQRSKEVSIAQGVGSSNISIVDRALAPGLPFQPNMARSLLQAIIISLSIGVGIAFLLNFFDDTIKTPEDVRNKLGLAVIGLIPKVSGKKDVVALALEQPRSTISEAFATAQTALEFSTADGAPRSLLITSTRPGEGKTSSTISLAMAFVRSGRRTLIIDADMRKPSFVVGSTESIGLSGLLTGHENLFDHVVRSKTSGLSILPAGVIPPDPAQLLASPRLKELIHAAKSEFDIVIIDSPPILNFSDGPRLGSVVDGALVVLQSGLIRTPAAKRTLIHLGDSRTRVLGCILTKFDSKSLGHDYDYYYSAYGHGSKKYVSTNSKRKILIDVEQDESIIDDTERWA